MMSHLEKNDGFVAFLNANRVQQEMLKTKTALLASKAAAAAPLSNQHGSSSLQLQQSHSFQTTFNEELRRIQQFVNDQQHGLEIAAKNLFLRAQTVATTADIGSVNDRNATVQELKQSTRTMVEDCIALQDFLTNSRQILLKHASMADNNYNQQRQTTTTTTTTTTTNAVNNYYSSLVYEILPKAHINSALVCIMSDIYNALRQAEQLILHQSNNANAGAGDTLWEAPSSFKRNTTKYWVKDEHLTKLMMICAAEAPLLVYGRKGPLTTSTNNDDINVSDGDKLWDSLATVITSIYFDSDDRSLYQERLKRAEGAQLLRARWYGTTMPKGDQIVFLELKTHHEKWVAQKSVKERASIQERDMVEFLRPIPWQKHDAEQMILRAAKPNSKAEDVAKQTALLLRMHKLVVKHKLTACVRSVYDRAAFQSSTSNDLRLTLDRNVTLIDERMQQQPRESNGQWCLTDSEAKTATRASVVPFNVFEVKLAGNDPMPTGLAQAEKDSTIELATKFSKFLTGAAAFHDVPILPYWAAHPAFYTFFELDKRASRCRPSASLESNNYATNQGEYNLMDSSNEMISSGNYNRIPDGVVIAPKTPARIEPKTYFANERTFVQWISASILLLSVSAFMLEATGGDFKKTAAVISFSALVLVVYSTGLYFKRLNLLKDRQPYGYFNKVNPIFLTTVVGLAIFLVWLDSMEGKDSIGVFSVSGRERRLLRSSLFSSRRLHEEESYEKCQQEEVVRSILSIKENPSSLVMDFKRNSFLITSDESIYIQPVNNDGSVLQAKAELLIRINQSHLRGLAIVDSRLFAISDGPERTELIEMAWWERSRVNGNQKRKLRVVERWTLENSKSQVDGFSYVPSTDSPSKGSFYINMNSSVHAYSVPTRSENEVLHRSSRPMVMKSLNMKVFAQGMTVEDKGSTDRLSTMITFEGITYVLRSEKQILEAWNLTDGTLFPEIKLPLTAEDNIRMKWKGFALERRIGTRTETPHVGAGDMLEMLSSDKLFLYLWTDDATIFGSQIWNFPVLEDIETRSGLFSVPACQIATTSMN